MIAMRISQAWRTSLVSITPRIIGLLAASLVGLLVWRYSADSFHSAKSLAIDLDQTLDRGLNGDPDSLDPRNFQSNQSSTVLRDIGEGLIRYLPTGEMRGGVASEWSVSDDGLEYIFKIRRDARWSNGDPVVAEDFVVAFRNLLDPSTAARNAGVLTQVKNASPILLGQTPVEQLGVQAASQSILVIKLDVATPTFLHVLTHPSTFPQFSRKALTPLSKISNGPYTLQERILGSEILLAKNKEYWNAKNVGYEFVRYHVVNELAEFGRFRANELDITGNVPSSIFGIAQSKFADELRVAPYLGVYYYGFNLRNPKMANNKLLRLALSLVVDRNALTNKVLDRGEMPAFGWIPPGVSNYQPIEPKWGTLGDDDRIQRAKALFEKSGYGPTNRLHLRLYFNSTDVQKRIATAIKSMWEDVLDVDVELIDLDFKVLISSIRSDPEVDIFWLSWTADYDDPEAFLRIFESGDASNYTGYKNLEFDELMRMARTTSSQVDRARMLHEAESILLADAPVMPLYFYVSKHLVKEDVVGWTPNILDIHESQFLKPRQ